MTSVEETANEFLNRTSGRCKLLDVLILAELMRDKNPCDGCELRHDRKECGGDERR